MNLRNLVPAMGILVVSAHFANAEDKAPTVTFSGWIDTIADFSTANVPADAPGTSKNEHRAEIGFTNEDSIKANIKVSDAVTGKINIFLGPADSAGASIVNVREGYLSWALNSEWTLTGGKYINAIGWISPEPTGYEAVYNSLIGYTAIYGNDVIGANLAFAKKDCPVSGSVHLVNGFFDGADASSVGPKSFTGGANNKSANRENTDLGYGLDLTYNLPKDNSFINLDVAFDPHGGIFANYALGSSTPGLDLGGSALLLGLNGQVQATKELLIAAEIMTFQVGDGKTGGTKVTDSGGSRNQGMLLANYALPKGTVSFPLSITGEFQMVETKSKASGAKTAKASQETVAVLTNPTSSTFFALNYDLSFTQFDDGTAGFKKINTTTLSVEALLSF